MLPYSTYFILIFYFKMNQPSGKVAENVPAVPDHP